MISKVMSGGKKRIERTKQLSIVQTPSPTPPASAPATQKAPAAPIISVSGSLTTGGYGGYATVFVISTATFINYTTSGNIPICTEAESKLPEKFILSSTAEVRCKHIILLSQSCIIFTIHLRCT